jgi:hypothetical protein
MVTMDIPKLGADRILRLVRVTINAGVVTCSDDAIRRDVESLKPICGVSGADPDPDYTRARECRLWIVRAGEKWRHFSRCWPAPAAPAALA